MTRFIKNFSALAKTPMRRAVLSILETGYQAIQTETVIKNAIKKRGHFLFIKNKKYNLSQSGRVVVIGIGKCSLAAGESLAKVLGSRLSGGIILDTRKKPLKKLTSLAGTHPLPSAKNIAYTQKILDYLSQLNPNQDLLIFIVSGGGSSLFCLPENISLSDYIGLTLDLHKSGANIHELNCVRKHLEAVKGGKLALRLKPLKTIVLYFSDVLSETSQQNLRTIASGPLQPDKTTNYQAKQVLKKYGLWSKYKNKIKRFSETAKNKKDFSHLDQYLLLTNQTALKAMALKAKQFKLKPKILTAILQAQAKLAFSKIKQLSKNFPQNNIFLAGGETMVRVKGRGKGGRNQEAVLAALPKLKNNELFAAAASDGIDFSPHAGALADWLTRQKAQKLRLKVLPYLSNNDSYNFFKKTGDYLKTGKIGSNIADLLLYYKTEKHL
jgi:glycerate-2-kinase